MQKDSPALTREIRACLTGGAPFHLTVLVDGNDLTDHVDLPVLFRQLLLTMEHEYTQLLTAASMVALFDALTTSTPTIVHAPGPIRLPGGYPVRVGNQGLEVVLPSGLSFEEAIRMNQEGQRFYGIERVEDDGTVYFMEKNMTILKDVLGYECRQMPLSEVEDRAKELQARYLALAKKYHQ